MFGIKLLKKFLLLLFSCIFIAYIFFHKEDVKQKGKRLNFEKKEFVEILKDESEYHRTEASDFITEQSETEAKQMVYEDNPGDDGGQITEGKINNMEIEYHIANNQSAIAEKKLPKIAILGVKKCGTIALSQMMKMHPSIMVPSNPEIWFWTLPREFKKGLEHYKVQIYKHNCKYNKNINYSKSQMPYVKDDQMTAVATPGILDKPEDITYLKRLHDAIPEIKVLLVVKNPIDRVVSDILHEFSAAQHKDEIMPDIDDIIMGRAGMIQQRGLSGLSLNDMVFYLSNYTLIYQMVSQVFPTKDLLVVNGDKLVTDPLQEIRRVESFLGLPAFYSQSHFVFPVGGRFPCFKFGEHDLCMDPKHKGREHPTLESETLNYLKSHFQPMVDNFFIESGISLQNFMDKFVD